MKIVKGKPDTKSESLAVQNLQNGVSSLDIIYKNIDMDLNMFVKASIFHSLSSKTFYC